MKFIFLLSVISYQFLVVPVAQAAIQYGDKSYTAPFAASTTNAVGGLVSGVDISNLNAGDISAGLGFFGSIKQFFINVDSWLKVNAGIDFFGIMGAIGHWIVITLEWILKALKMVL